MMLEMKFEGRVLESLIRTLKTFVKSMYTVSFALTGLSEKRQKQFEQRDTHRMESISC